MLPSIRKSLARFFTPTTSTPTAGVRTLVSDVRRLTQDLPPLERDRRLRYKRFAERQNLIEVENQADHERDLH